MPSENLGGVYADVTFLLVRDENFHLGYKLYTVLYGSQWQFYLAMNSQQNEIPWYDILFW